MLCMSAPILAQELSFSTYNQKQGIKQPYVYNITQNDQGFLYFTTSEGAYRFDGLKFERIDGNNVLKEPFFKSILILEDRTTFLGTNTGGVFRFKNGKVIWKFISPLHTAPVIKILEHQDKYYAFYQNGAILEISKNGSRKFQSLTPGYLYSSFSAYRGKFIAGKDIGFTVFSIEKGNVKEEKTITVNNDAVESICVTKKTIFLGTGNSGLYIYENGQLSKLDLKDDALNKCNVKAIYKDELSSIWISAYGMGVYEIKRNSSTGVYYVRTTISMEKGLPNKYVTSLFLDRESNLWMGSLGGGVSKLNSNSLIQYDLTEYGYGNSVFSIYQSKRQICGLKGGILEIDSDSDEIAEFFWNSQLPKDNITSINYHNATKTFYIGTEKSGLYAATKGNKVLKHIPLSIDYLSRHINHVNVVENLVYLSTMNGVYRYNIITQAIDHFSSKDGLPNNVVVSTFFKSDGKLLIGTRSKSLFYLQNNEIGEIRMENPYGLLNINNFAEDRRGQIWISTNGQGVFHLTDKQFNRMSTGIGLYSDYVYQMIIDKKNTVWCGHRGGLSRITDKEKILDKFDFSDNVTMDFLLNACAIDALNNVWLGTDAGALKFSILQDKFNIFNAKPVMINAMVNDIIVDNPSELNLRYQKNQIKFIFQTISLTFPEEVLYQYRLKGLDNKWSAPSSDNTATLGQLMDGEYQLEVRSKVGNGDWSEAVVLSQIYVAPPFWFQWWFIVLFVVVVMSFGVGISSYRTRALKKQKVILEAKLSIRTKEIENKNAKITQQFDEIQESIDYGVRIQKSLLPEISTLKKYIPDSFLYFQPKDKVSGDFYYFEKFNDRLIVSVADATGHGVPGAFISLIGFVSLKEIIHRSAINNPAQILSELDEEINTTLGQYNRLGDGKDGMDMAVCDIDLKTYKLVMASALRPIWLFRDGKFEKIRSSKSTVGGGMANENAPRKEYDGEERQLKKGDTIYMFTDGYVDQFGSDRDKKLMSKRFLNLLQENYHLSMEEQGKLISEYLNSWKGNRDQTDDVLVIGLRL